MKKTKINNINTEITRVEPGQYVFHHEMARITEILYNAANDNWQITTPSKHILGDLNHQKMVDILMGHCGFEADSSRVLAAALTLELASAKEANAEKDNQLKNVREEYEAKLQSVETEKNELLALIERVQSAEAEVAQKEE